MRYLEALATRAAQTPAVRLEMERAAREWGIDLSDVEAKPPLSEAAAAEVRRSIDEMHNEFEQNPSEDLAREIVRLQIELNMRNPEALYEPGSVRERVSREVGLAGGPLTLGEAYADLLSQRAEIFRKLGDLEADLRTTVEDVGGAREPEIQSRLLREAAAKYDISKNAWRFLELAQRAGLEIDVETRDLAYRIYQRKSIDGIIVDAPQMEAYVRGVMDMQVIIIAELEAMMRSPGRPAHELRFNLRQRLQPVLEALEPLVDSLRSSATQMHGVPVHAAVQSAIAAYQREQQRARAREAVPAGAAPGGR
jgi:hypothetical protein